jgi:hypothetical protein
MLPEHLRLRVAYEEYMRNPNATTEAHHEPIPPDTAGRICSLAHEKAARLKSRESRSNEVADEVREARLSRWTAVRHRRM